MQQFLDFASYLFENGESVLAWVAIIGYSQFNKKDDNDNNEQKDNK